MILHRKLSFRCHPTPSYSLSRASEQARLYGSDMASHLSHRGLSSSPRCVTLEPTSSSEPSTRISGQLPGTSSLLFYYFNFFFLSIVGIFCYGFLRHLDHSCYRCLQRESSDLSRLPFDLQRRSRCLRQITFQLLTVPCTYHIQVLV